MALAKDDAEAVDEIAAPADDVSVVLLEETSLEAAVDDGQIQPRQPG
jgi:hypothetical protein